MKKIEWTEDDFPYKAIIKRLVGGEIYPIGDSSVDGERFKRQLNVESIIFELLYEDIGVLPYIESQAWSEKHAGEQSLAFLKRIREIIDGWVEEYDEDEK